MSLFDKISEFFENLVEHQQDHVTVTVKKGDSLWKIAETMTGDGQNWKKIVAANSDKAWGSDFMLQPGDVLNLPNDMVE